MAERALSRPTPLNVAFVFALLLSACGAEGTGNQTTGSGGNGSGGSGGGGSGGSGSGGVQTTDAAGSGGNGSGGAVIDASGDTGPQPGTGGAVVDAANDRGGNSDATPTPDGGNGPLSPAVVTMMRKVADWQLPRAGGAKDWQHGGMWTGIMATYKTTKDQKYLDAIKTWATPQWNLSGGAGARGDNQCAAQTFFETYLLDPVPANLVMVNNAKMSFDQMLGQNTAGRVEWWWEDALFMVPPGFARLGAITGDKKYFDKMNTLYWDTYAFLWSNSSSLMFRDNNSRGAQWARGNGWVIAGAARVLDYLPQDDAKRPNFVKLIQDMAGALKKVQGADGCWRSNLLNAGAVPNPETSGTGFFTFGMSWGMNHGILDKATYLDTAHKGWDCLVSHVAASGMLGYVQQVGAGPAPAGMNDTETYGVGAFLLAGSEIAKLIP
jgi:rhamnogalacturonyl hydrolase YesR